MGASLNAMAQSHCRQKRHPSWQGHRRSRFLIVAAAATLARPQPANALLRYMQPCWSTTCTLTRSSRGGAATYSSMSSVSSKVQQQEGGDGGQLLSPGAIEKGDCGGGGGVGEAVTISTTGLEHGESEHPGQVQVGESNTQEHAKRSKWSWGRKKQEDQEEQARGGGLFTYDWDNGDRIVWKASKKSKAEVEEGSRKLGDYLALPPTEYSLLDPKMVTRLSEETFRMDGATMSIVGTKIKPVIFVKVKVQPEHNLANIMVERVELDGSEAVRSAAGSFNVTSSTVVSCSEMEDTRPAKLMELRTSSDIEIEILVPNENFVPLGVLRRAGNFVMQRVVDIGLPQFTKFLKRDYARWAEGDDTRAAVVSEGETLIASDEI